MEVRADRLLCALEELSKNEELARIYPLGVLESLVVAAEGNELWIEDGGSVELGDEEKRVILSVLSDAVRNTSPRSTDVHSRVSSTGRARIRCDVLMGVLQDLGGRENLKSIFGGEVSACLVVAAEDGDLKIENLENVHLSDEESEAFMSALGEAIGAQRG